MNTSLYRYTVRCLVMHGLRSTLFDVGSLIAWESEWLGTVVRGD
jgi:hypothetical protein